MENNNPENVTAFEVFNNTEDLAASMNQEQTVAEPVAEQPTESVEQPFVEEAPEQFEQSAQEVQQPIEEASQSQPEYSEADLEQAVMSFMSERLGREINSLDDFSIQQETNAIDERVEAIARFVEETGRAPEDWFRFQSLNPEGMDDMTAIRIQMSNEYPNLSYDELNLLVNSKYKVDADLYSEEEVNLAKLQMKMDGDKARQSIEDIRQGYAAPEYESEAPESVIDEQWISNMVDEVETLEGLEFDLGDGNLFEFGLDETTKINSWTNKLVSTSSLILMYGRMVAGITTCFRLTWLSLTTLTELLSLLTPEDWVTDREHLWTQRLMSLLRLPRKGIKTNKQTLSLSN